MKFIRHIVVSLSLLAPLGVGLSFNSTKTTRFSSSISPVVNPGKGWVSYGLPKGKSALELEFSTVGYERFDWGIVEPRENEFNWSAIDRFIDSWASIGKKAAFGVMSANSHAGEGQFVTPRWVFDSGVKINARHLSNDGDIMRGKDGLYISPDDFNDPIFLSNLENFVRVFSERYDGDPRIAFIDI